MIECGMPPSPEENSMGSIRLILTTLAVLSLGICALEAKRGSSSGSSGDTYVRGYTRSDGTYVAPHYRSNPNSTQADNWSTIGNVNPYTGKKGTKAQDASSGANGSQGYPGEHSGYTYSGTVSESVTIHAAPRIPEKVRTWGDLQFNMTRDEVRKILGSPVSETSDRWTYPNGGLVLFSGKSISWITPKHSGTARSDVEKQDRDPAVSPREPRGIEETTLELAAWKKLQPYMTKAQVQKLLGKPLRKSDDVWYYRNYGYVAFRGSGTSWMYPNDLR